MTLDRIERVAKILAVVIAGFGVYKYFGDIEQQKSTRTLQYFDEFHSGPILAAREHIGTVFYLVMNGADEIEGNPDISGDDVLDALIAQPHTRIKFDMVIEFFSRVHACVKVGSCDRATARTLFQPQAAHLMELQLRPLVDPEKVVRGGRAQGLVCLSGLRPDLCWR